MLSKVGFCPWCGRERSIEAYFPNRDWFEWETCKTPRCKGVFVIVVTDQDGFVIHPAHKRGYNVYVRPEYLR